MSKGPWKHTLEDGVPADARERYHIQKHHSKQRGIEWKFTPVTWWAWWGDDYQYRGRSKGCLVMARPNDLGPYSPDNCYKATVRENHQERTTRLKDQLSETMKKTRARLLKDFGESFNKKSTK